MSISSPAPSQSRFPRLSAFQLGLIATFLLSTVWLFWHTWDLQTACNPLVTSQTNSCQIQSIKLSPSKITLNPGESQIIKVTVKLEKDSGQKLEQVRHDLRWESDNPQVFRVDRDRQFPLQKGKSTGVVEGAISAVQPGIAHLEVVYPNHRQKTATADVTVRGIQQVEISPSSLSLAIGEKQSLQAIVRWVGDGDKRVLWSSDNDAVEVNDKGHVHAQHEGTATITATAKADPQKVAQIPVTVNSAVTIESVRIQGQPGGEPTDLETLDIRQGEDYELTALMTGNGANAEQVSWKVNNEQIARLEGQGRQVTLHALQPGTIEVKAISEQDKRQSATLKVTVLSPQVTGVQILPKMSDPHLNVDESGQLCAQVQGRGDYDHTVTWYSSRPEVATVDPNGQVTAQAKGETTLTAVAAADPGKSAFIDLKVPRNANWLAIATGTVVAAGTMVILVPPPVAIAIGAGAALLVNQWQATGFSGC